MNKIIKNTILIITLVIILWQIFSAIQGYMEGKEEEKYLMDEITFKFAVDNSDADACREISDVSRAAECVAEVARKMGDNNTCTAILQSGGSSDLYNNCLDSVSNT